MKKYILPLLTCVILASCGNKKKEQAVETDATPEVKVTTVKSEDIAQTEVYSATVESDVKNNISPNVPYRIEKIYVEVGDQVRKGQLLVQLDASSLRQLKLQIENQKLEYNRTNELYKVGGASKAEHDNAKIAYNDRSLVLIHNTLIKTDI